MVNNEFADAIVEGLAKRNEYEYRWENVKKNNNVVLTGIFESCPESNLSACIYADYYEEDYQREQDLESIINKISKLFNERRLVGEHTPITPENFSLAKVKDRLRAKLVNLKRNEGIPIIPCGDELALSFYVDVTGLFDPQVSDFAASVRVTEGILDFWGVSLDTIAQFALQNEDTMDYQIMPISDIVKEHLRREIPFCMMSDEEFEQFCEYNLPTDSFMYVLTNHDTSKIPVAILAKDMLKEFCCSHGYSELFVIPSSISEVILLDKAQTDGDPEAVRAMIEQVNGEVVDPTEVLSDVPFIYDLKSNTLKNAKTGVNVLPMLS